jgi:RNA-directed DNA polymerase
VRGAGREGRSLPRLLELDIQKFFDSLDHRLVVKAVKANTDQKWVLLYVKRWLKAPLQLPDGTVQDRDRGTPQGSAVSPVLANLVLHYAFDMFLAREFPTVAFERYADDAVVHCVTERQARQVRAALAERLEGLGLQLHPDKTKIVYCKDDKRRGDHTHTSFTFLGYTFQPRGAIDNAEKPFLGFSPAVSADALAKMSAEVRRWRLHLHTGHDLAGLAAWLNPIVAGWMNLRPVLPVAVVSPVAAHQHLPDALGRKEIQAAARLSPFPPVVVRDRGTRPRAVRALAVGAHVRRIAMRRAE